MGEPERPPCPIGPVPFWGLDESELVNELQAGPKPPSIAGHPLPRPVYNLILSMLGDRFGRCRWNAGSFFSKRFADQIVSPGSFAEDLVVSHRHREALNHKRWFKRHLQKNVSIRRGAEEGTTLSRSKIWARPVDQLAATKFQQRVSTLCRKFPQVFRGAVILRDLEA